MGAEEIAIRFGENLRRIREERNLNQSELARQLRTGPARINNIEWGRAGVSIPFAIRLCNILGCDIEDLFTGKRKESQSR